MSFNDLPFFPVTNGSVENGKDGVSPVISVASISGGHELTIVDAAGTKTIEVLDGTIGPQGIQGIQGIQGPTGEQGPKGDQGATGPQGPKGDKGDKGDTGEQGPKGDKGDIGEQGNQGEIGPTGQAGKDGIDGKSAYKYAQEGGYTGTEAEFTEIIAHAVNKQNISLGLHTDGRLYLFIDGEPVGTGIEKSSESGS